MRFGLYLVKRDLITSDQLVEALNRQEEGLPTFGQLAMEEGILSVRDVFRVLRVQSTLSLAQFGQTAIDLDLLNRQQVAELLLLQSDRRTPLGDVLVEMGALDRETIDAELTDFRRSQAKSGAARGISVTRAVVPQGV